ncbi:hypothetical protein B0H19DRAFT_1063527 [Mycena capillaripes]|nr:hypothetical protein B0H19DRAFT_1063527 [Mycena capillaripes]
MPSQSDMVQFYFCFPKCLNPGQRLVTLSAIPPRISGPTAIEVGKENRDGGLGDFRVNFSRRVKTPLSFLPDYLRKGHWIAIELAMRNVRTVPYNFLESMPRELQELSQTMETESLELGEPKQGSRDIIGRKARSTDPRLRSATSAYVGLCRFTCRISKANTGSGIQGNEIWGTGFGPDITERVVRVFDVYGLLQHSLDSHATPDFSKALPDNLSFKRAQTGVNSVSAL